MLKQQASSELLHTCTHGFLLYTISQTQWTLVTAHKKTHKLNKESERERRRGGGGERILDTRDMARAGHHRHAQQHQCGLAASAGRKGAGESRKAAAAFCDWLRASGPTRRRSVAASKEPLQRGVGGQLCLSTRTAAATTTGWRSCSIASRGRAPMPPSICASRSMASLPKKASYLRSHSTPNV